MDMLSYSSRSSKTYLFLPSIPPSPFHSILSSAYSSSFTAVHTASAYNVFHHSRCNHPHHSLSKFWHTQKFNPKHSNTATPTTTTMFFDQLANSFEGTLKKLTNNDKITEKNIEKTITEVRRALLDADVNLKVVNSLLKEIKARAIGAEVAPGINPGQLFVKILYEELTKIMGGTLPVAGADGKVAPPGPASTLVRAEGGRPTIIVLAGLQGAGKTTAAAKLALYCQKEANPRKVLLIAADIYRPAAIDQLQTLGKQIDTPVFTLGKENPVTIVKKGIEYAKEIKADTIIIDTAGRQVIDQNLMSELKEIKKASKADETLLVVDAMTGQEAATLTKAFSDQIGITGAILTKLDGDTRGGAALSVNYVSGKPIKFIGIGEKVEKLDLFYPDRMASRIVGMGDVLSLVEKAQENFNIKEAENITKKMMENKYDFDDFLKQARAMKSMGSMGGLIKMMPGVSGITDKQIRDAEQRLKNSESMIFSMTKKERRNPELLLSDRTAKSRLQRIAKGSGRSYDQVYNMIQEFKKMKAMMQGMSQQMLQKGGPNPNANPMASLMNRAARRKSEKNKNKKNDGPKRGFGA